LQLDNQTLGLVLREYETKEPQAIPPVSMERWSRYEVRHQADEWWTDPVCQWVWG
jgi:hypothetical protein